MALYRNVSWDELDSLGVGMPRPNQTRVYDALGRNTGTDNNDNFFVKRGKSLENAFGTTGAAIVSGIDSARESAKANSVSDMIADKSDEIARKYGFADRGAYWDALSAAEESGNKDELERLDSTIGAEMRGLTSAIAKETDQAAKDWKDYRENSYVGQKINQDRGKFAGSAINTLSTMSDVMLPAAGVAFNSVQGGLEGIADELEQNGLENFDWGRAGQNALIGATTGAVTGGLNKGLNSALAKNGGNLFKGGNALTRGLNNLGSQTAVGRIGSTLATGAGRGALSGAVGGATGAGLSAAMNGQDVLGSAIEGAKRGATQGAMAGGIMAGANMIASKTPGIGTAMQKINQANEDFKNSGDNTLERLENTWNSGDSPVANRITEDVNAVKRGFQDVGEGVSNLAKRGVSALDDTYTQAVNKNAVERLSNALDKASTGGVKGNTKFVRITGELLDEFNTIRNANGLDPLSKRQVVAYENAINENLTNRVREGMTTEDVAQMAFNALTSDNSKAVPGYYENQIAVSEPGIANDYDGVVIGKARNGGTSLKSIEPRTKTQVEMFEQTGQQKIGPKSRLGSSPVEEQPVNNSIVPQNRQNVNTTAGGRQGTLTALEQNPNFQALDSTDKALLKVAVMNGTDTLGQSKISADTINSNLETMQQKLSNGDLSKAQIQDMSKYYDEYSQTSNTPETEVYRTLTGQKNKASLDYGESELGNRTRRGMLADSLERFGNTLEGAQTNVTRAAAKDLGIESTGKVVENVRKKTGITNLETQAKIARELTGGSNSLMDNIQRDALSTRTDGKPYKVDTTDIVNEVDDIVNKYADTNMFGTGKAKETFIANLKKDIGNMDTDVLSISNRMKANAADLRGKGVAAATPSDSAKAKIYSEIANKLDDLSYNAIPQEKVDALFDDTISEMRGRAVQSAESGNKDVAKAYNKLADALDTEPRTIKAYRSFKKDFVDVSKINDLTAQAENGAASQLGRSLGGGIKRFVSTVAQRPINAALAKVGGVVNNAADKIGGDQTVPTATTIDTTSQPVVETAYNPATRVYEAIGRTEGLTNAEQARTANYLTSAVQDTNAQNSVLTNTMPTTASTSLYNSLYSNNNLNTTGISDIANTANITDTTSTTTGTGSNTYFQPTGDYWTDILAKAMSAAIDADDVTAFASLYGMYQDSLANLQKSSTGKDYTDVTTWNSSDRTKLLSAQNAMDQIDQLENAYYNATGGDGGNFLQGNLRSLAANISGGNLDASANNYNKLAESVGMGIVKNLINLGVTEADAKRYLEYLPALTDTKEQAAQKLDTLRNIYQSQINNLYSAYGL